MKNILVMDMKECKERPRTKRLERPTPNLKHPVIINRKSKEIDSQITECIEGIDKCITTSVKTCIKSTDIKQNCKSVPNILYRTSDQQITKEDIKTDKNFTTNKLSRIRYNKSGHKYSSISNTVKDNNRINKSSNTENKSNDSSKILNNFGVKLDSSNSMDISTQQKTGH